MPVDNNYGPHLIGHRVSTEDGDIGTVKFVGPLTNSPNDCWLGVDWDDPKRGKHDGSFKGVRYFDTRFSTSGSFVRPNKVLFGISVMKAIKQRYSCDDSLMKDLDNPTILLKRSHGDVNIEMVGIKKVGKLLNDLKTIVCANLHGHPISYSGIEEGDAESLANLKEIILSKTLLSSWLEIAKICESLPQIRVLNVSGNKLNPICQNLSNESLPKPDGDQLHLDQKTLLNAFKHITDLIANRLDYSWNELLPILNCTSQLKTLSAAENHLNQLPNPCFLSGLQFLTYLDLTSNQISNFSEVLWPLGEQLLHLEFLHLKANQITGIHFPGSILETTPLFPSLSTLFVSDNQISDWSSVDQCNRLNSLTSLVILNNPVLTNGVHNVETAIQIAIAKLERVTIFNHITISREERRGAEIDYLKRNGEAWYEAGGSQSSDGDITSASSAFIEKHPRYEKLVAIHGAPEKSEFVKISGRIREGLLRVYITYPGKPTFERSIPQSMSVLQLKRFIKRTMKLKYDDISLVYTTEKSKTEYPIDNETRDINFFGVANGDTIHARPNC